ncbi:MAG: NAD-dependent dehydratase [Sneathiella sp.]|uniref:NAD-dependent epimerase/dehydratase family protein n=1 Tax=Sneathiella sp. TaxID=1964365 RepID=UPI000C613E08|nr:NAD(P)-dependent oxidoreductase [Sneathiella sp.]MAL80461.1 NAD-dependent dehydratase [Sneathiella sp.]
MRRCLVTGATGFIGPHVVRRMLDCGWEVISLSRHEELPLAGAHRHIAVDLHDIPSMEMVIKEAAASHLIHLAWEATPGKFWHSTENFHWVSTSAYLLDAFVKTGGKRAVLAGSCAEYQWQPDALVEDRSTAEGDSLYAASKLAFRRLAHTIGQEIDLVWARLFFPYGPDEDASKLTSYIFRELCADRLPTFQTPGNGIDLIHVTDVARALERLAVSDLTGTVNISSGRAVLPPEIALEAAKLLGKEALVPPLTELVEETSLSTALYGDNRRLMSVWEGAPMLSLVDGLKSYLKV